MDPEKAKALAARFENQGKMRFKDGASPEQIKAFEKEYSVVLPSRLKEWLVFSDGGEFFLPFSHFIKGCDKPNRLILQQIRNKIH